LPDLAFLQTDDSNPASVVVVGRSGSGTYEASEISGTKSGLPVRELPQSVRVMTRQAIDDLGATRLDEVLDFVGGVSRQNSFGGLWDNFAIRGLPGNENTGMPTLLNGFQAIAASMHHVTWRK
jgi:iron complex outermembrane receptor protein